MSSRRSGGRRASRNRGPRRVVITGIGLVSPVGTGVAVPWEAMLRGETGIGPITRFDASRLPVRIAGEVKGFDAAAFLGAREARRTDLFIQYALAAGQVAMEDAGLRTLPVPGDRAAVLVGVGIGGLPMMEAAADGFYARGNLRFSPFFVTGIIPNLAAGNLAIRFGARGPCLCPVSACASGAHAIGEAVLAIRRGIADFALAGGSEAVVTPLALGGFAAMKALSTRNDDPARASRPFDRDRDGFVLAEGAAIVVLEEEEAARERGARLYAEVRGYAATADAFHITQPDPEGEGAVRCMRLALANAGCEPAEVDYVNAHGTSTRYNDYIETEGIKRVFGDHAFRLAISSTKSVTGHLLGAAGALEAAVCALAVREDRIPPTANLEDTGDPAAAGAEFVCDPRLDYVRDGSRQRTVRVALSNSFGFGGTNACLVLAKPGLVLGAGGGAFR